jgi:3-oxoacyl-[acyl-carrier-protein] synthase II
MIINPVFINGLGNVSPQKTTNNQHFLAEPLTFETNLLKAIDPGYKEFIPADLIRRMGRMIKMGVAASKLCLRDAGSNSGETGMIEVVPEAIITGTGLGCMEDTEKFLISMIQNHEEFLTPTSFIQSTHNTVAGQIALLLRCHGYNFTFVHRGVSFESALIDAMTQMQLNEFSNALVGGTDEITPNTFAITSRLGYWKRKPVDTLHLLEDPQRGTIAGEGASFFFLKSQKNNHTYAKLTGVETFLKPSTPLEISQRLGKFLNSCGLKLDDLSLVILGLNGDPHNDQVYKILAEKDFQNTSLAYFKHLCGEYHTASAFATWLAAKAIKTQLVPAIVSLKSSGKPTSGMNTNRQFHLEHVLIYNHFRENNHAFILLSRP